MPKAKKRAVAHASRTVHAVRRTGNKVTRRHNKRKNPTYMVVASKHRGRHRPRAVNRRRNPQFFGRNMRVGEVAKVVAGGLVGVGAVKLVVPMLPAVMTSNNFFRFGSAVVLALGFGWLANKVSPDFGSAVMFGGLMESASIGLNPFIPVSQYTGLSGRSGLRAYVSAQFNEPMNPFPQSALPMPGAAVTRVYKNPYTARAVA